MDEKVNKIGPRTFDEWIDYLWAGNCLRRERLAEFEEAVREETRGSADWRKGVIREAVRHADAKIREAETRPCVSCDNGRILEPSCPELLCKDGRVPRDYAMVCVGIAHMIDEVGYRDDVDPYAWARAKYGMSVANECERSEHGAAGEEAADDRG